MCKQLFLMRWESKQWTLLCSHMREMKVSVCSKTKSYWIQREFLLLFIFLFRSRFSGRLPSDPIFQAICLQILFFGPHAFRILDKTYLPKPWILDPFQQSEPCPVRWVPRWLDTKGPHGGNKSTSLLLLHWTAIGLIEHQEAVLFASNKSYSHHPHGGSKGLKLCVKLLTWLGLICRMTQSSAYNCKTIREDPVPNGIKSKKVVFQQMGK